MMGPAGGNGLWGIWVDVFCQPLRAGSRPQQGRFTSFLSPWLQEWVKAEELMEQRAVEQDQPDGDKCQGTDRSSRSSSEPRAPSRGTKPADQRQKPGSDRKQYPRVLRARDEF